MTSNTVGVRENSTTTGPRPYWVSQHSRPVIFLILTLGLLGAYLAFTIPVSVFPQTNFPRVLIGVDNGVMPIDQMMVTITRPLEEAVNSVPGLLTVRSVTGRGSAEVDLYFRWDVDMFQTLQYVNAAISRVQPELPPTAVIRADRLTFAAFPVIAYSVTSDSTPQTRLWEMATYEMKPRLNRLDGVSTVIVQGGQEPEFQIMPDPAKLLAASVTVTDILDAVRRTNLVDSPGLLEQNHQLYLGLVNGQVRTPDEIAHTVIKNTPAGVPIRIGDIAAVSPSVKPVYTVVTANGKPAVLLNINRQPDGNTVEVAREVHDEIEKIRRTVPPGITIEPFYDQSILVTDSIKSVRDAILIGLILASIILVVFLRDWGTSLVAGLVIPVTVMVTFIALKLMGQTFNLMTLGGLAAAVGLVIDDAIVVVENIFTHIARGQSRRAAVESAVSEITVPIIGSTITPVVVFLPLTLLTGVTGVFFRSLALTMSVALLTSLVLALSFTPVLAERFVKAKRRDDADEDEVRAPHGRRDGKTRADALEEGEAQGGPFLRAIIRRYEWVLGHALDNRSLVLVLIVCVLAGSYVLYRALGSEFLPEFDESAFVLDYWAPAGSSLTETDRMLNHVEDLLNKTPEVESFSRRTGLELGLFTTEPNRGDFAVKLKPGHKRATEEVMDDLRKQIEASEPRLEIEFVGILSDMIGDLTSSPEPIEIKLFSEDTKALHEKASEVEEAIKKVSGVVDTKNGVVVSGPAVTFQIDPQRAARFGVTATDVANTVTTAMSGDAASSILQQDRLITVRVIFPAELRTSLDALRALQVRSATGVLFRVDQVADVDYDKGQTEIAREGLRQTVAVTGRITGSDLGTVIGQIKTQLAKDVKFPPGMTVEYGGLYGEQQASFRELAISLILAVVLVFITLLIEFRSFAHPVSIVAGAVLALAGVLLGLFITGTTLNVVSFMGMIMVVGIVAKNGILMLDAVEDHLQAGDTLREALLRSGRRRFRPVLMTSLAAILGMLPLALAIGSGAELLQPLAIAVIGGLAVALLLSLVVTPTVYALLRREPTKMED